ncbi:MAG: MG2 domain-containing protein, partial [Bacteroidales bacterium]|nr:MG2 domain-containing protein [Bacteroidales bacterium]
FQKKDHVAAHETATRGKESQPKSLGATQCHNLIERIEAKEVNLQTERVWNRAKPEITIAYRNIDQVNFRIIPVDYKEYLKRQNELRYLDGLESDTILRADPMKTWTEELPPTLDYQQRVISLPSPTDLPPGLYYLIASHHAQFTTKATDHHINITPFWVSDLALVVNQSHRFGTRVNGLVTHAVTGQPIVGAKVTRYITPHRKENQWVIHDTIQTDRNGQFQLPPTQTHKNYSLLVQHKEHTLSSDDTYYDERQTGPDDPHYQTVFFTDRSLYRPGQTIHYKGICLRTHTSQAEYQTRTHHALTVVLYDNNHQEVARHQHTTNVYGSFSGSFTAPRDRVLGRMTIRVDGQRRSSTQIRVEEYKRPKFQVELSLPPIAPKLDTKVEVLGKATAYTGAAIGDAQVQWRVERSASYPRWCWWAAYTWPPQATSAQTIAFGT